MNSFNPNAGKSQQTQATMVLDDATAEHCQAVIQALSAQFGDQPIPHDQFMQFCLYEPGLGYYNSDHHCFGQDGDFTTAPLRSALFGQTLGHWCVKTATSMTNDEKQSWQLIDWGGGHGHALMDCLDHCRQVNNLPEIIQCIDISEHNLEQWRTHMQSRHPDLLTHCRWSSVPSLEQAMMPTVIIANELLDALPVVLFRVTKDGIEEQAFTINNHQLEVQWQPARSAVHEAVKTIQQECDITLPTHYQSEINLSLRPIFEAVNQFSQVCALFIDYGYPQKEYYIADRDCGTFRCYFKHQAHDNPIFAPGRQDMTAHVDFTAAAIQAHASGLKVLGYTNQAAFLMDCGIGQQDMSALDTETQLQMGTELKQLLLASTMGETFKAFVVGKAVEPPVGFNIRNDLHKL